MTTTRVAADLCVCPAVLVTTFVSKLPPLPCCPRRARLPSTALAAVHRGSGGVTTTTSARSILETMAPPSPRTQSNKSTAHNNSDTIDSLTAPSWDTSLASKPLYLDALVRWLQTQDGKYRTLVEYGIVIQKHHTVTTSANHMDRHYHGLIIREVIEDHKIRCPFVATVDNLADFFTKPLRASVFFPMRDRIMNVSPELSPRGGVKPRPSKYSGRGG